MWAILGDHAADICAHIIHALYGVLIPMVSRTKSYATTDHPSTPIFSSCCLLKVWTLASHTAPFPLTSS